MLSDGLEVYESFGIILVTFRKREKEVRKDYDKILRNFLKFRKKEKIRHLFVAAYHFLWKIYLGVNLTKGRFRVIL